MALTEPIVDVLIHLDPALDYGPDWMPAPDPPVKIPILTARGSWSDVFDWIKAHAVLPAGKPITDPFGTLARTQQMIDASAGSVLAAVSGFLNRAAALTVQAAAILDDSITNLASIEQFDYRDLSTRLDQIQNVQTYIVGTVIPAIEVQFATERSTMLHVVADAETYQQRWATDNILAPLVESLGTLNTQLRQVIDLKAEEAHQISAQQVAGLAAQLAPAIAAATAAGAAANTWIDDCGEPMCQSMGPKTDLGKLLKGLQAALAAGALLEIANAKESDVADAITRVAKHAVTIVDTFVTDFLHGSETLAGLVTSELGNLI